MKSIAVAAGAASSRCCHVQPAHLRASAIRQDANALIPSLDRTARPLGESSNTERNSYSLIPTTNAGVDPRPRGVVKLDRARRYELASPFVVTAGRKKHPAVSAVGPCKKRG